MMQFVFAIASDVYWLGVVTGIGWGAFAGFIVGSVCTTS